MLAEGFLSRAGVPNDGISISPRPDHAAGPRSPLNSIRYRPYGVPQARMEERSGRISNLAGAAIATVAGALSTIPNAFSTTTVMRFAESSPARRESKGEVANGR